MKKETAWNFQTLGLAGLKETETPLKDMVFTKQEKLDLLEEIAKLKTEEE